MKNFSIFIFALIVIALIAIVTPVHALDLGGLNIKLASSATKGGDTEMILKFKDNTSAGAGYCSAYAWTLMINGTSFGDLLSACAIATGDIKGDNAHARATVGISPINIIGIRPYFAIDVLHGGFGKGAGVSYTAAHDYFGK